MKDNTDNTTPCTEQCLDSYYKCELELWHWYDMKTENTLTWLR